MTKKKWKALLFNMLGFVLIYSAVYYLVISFTHLTGYWIPITAAVAASLLAPKYQVVVYQGEEKIFMKWLFAKGVKEIK